ncbi:MAG: hypothetical protein IKE52_03440 [Mogibacterium sp.]|nr:hypothetical protein [Mogibacterium sp.]
MAVVMSALPSCGALLFGLFIIKEPEVFTLAKIFLIFPAFFLLIILLYLLVRYRTLKRYIAHNRIMNSIENNLISIGAYVPKNDACYVILPKIRVKRDAIYINMKNVKIRHLIERYKNTFSTALPGEYVVDDIELSQNSNTMKIVYEDLRQYQQEIYSIDDYVDMIKSQSLLDFYFDKKHIVDLSDYPHWLLSGGTGSGKTVLAQELLIQAIVKGFETYIFDCKHTYGLFREKSNYETDPITILSSLSELENEMNQRYLELEHHWINNPRAVANDLGFSPIFILIEEYSALQDELQDKKDKEELKRIMRVLSKKARQCSMHLFVVTQTSGVDVIESSTRAQMNKVLLGNVMNNILTSTFQADKEEIPAVTFHNKGEGLIQTKKINVVRVPYVENIENSRLLKK